MKKLNLTFLSDRPLAAVRDSIENDLCGMAQHSICGKAKGNSFCLCHSPESKFERCNGFAGSLAENESGTEIRGRFLCTPTYLLLWAIRILFIAVVLFTDIPGLESSVSKMIALFFTLGATVPLELYARNLRKKAHNTILLYIQTNLMADKNRS